MPQADIKQKKDYKTWFGAFLASLEKGLSAVESMKRDSDEKSDRRSSSENKHSSALSDSQNALHNQRLLTRARAIAAWMKKEPLWPDPVLQDALINFDHFDSLLPTESLQLTLKRHNISETKHGRMKCKPPKTTTHRATNIELSQRIRDRLTGPPCDTITITLGEQSFKIVNDIENFQLYSDKIFQAAETELNRTKAPMAIRIKMIAWIYANIHSVYQQLPSLSVEGKITHIKEDTKAYFSGWFDPSHSTIDKVLDAALGLGPQSSRLKFEHEDVEAIDTLYHMPKRPTLQTPWLNFWPFSTSDNQCLKRLDQNEAYHHALIKTQQVDQIVSRLASNDDKTNTEREQLRLMATLSELNDHGLLTTAGQAMLHELREAHRPLYHNPKAPTSLLNFGPFRITQAQQDRHNSILTATLNIDQSSRNNVKALLTVLNELDPNLLTTTGKRLLDPNSPSSNQKNILYKHHLEATLGKGADKNSQDESFKSILQQEEKRQYQTTWRYQTQASLKWLAEKVWDGIKALGRGIPWLGGKIWDSIKALGRGIPWLGGKIWDSIKATPYIVGLAVLYAISIPLMFFYVPYHLVFTSDSSISEIKSLLNDPVELFLADMLVIISPFIFIYWAVTTLYTRLFKSRPIEVSQSSSDEPPIKKLQDKQKKLDKKLGLFFEWIKEGLFFTLKNNGFHIQSISNNESKSDEKTSRNDDDPALMMNAAIYEKALALYDWAENGEDKSIDLQQINHDTARLDACIKKLGAELKEAPTIPAMTKATEQYSEQKKAAIEALSAYHTLTEVLNNLIEQKILPALQEHSKHTETIKQACLNHLNPRSMNAKSCEAFLEIIENPKKAKPAENKLDQASSGEPVIKAREHKSREQQPVSREAAQASLNTLQRIISDAWAKFDTEVNKTIQDVFKKFEENPAGLMTPDPASYDSLSFFDWFFGKAPNVKPQALDKLTKYCAFLTKYSHLAPSIDEKEMELLAQYMWQEAKKINEFKGSWGKPLLKNLIGPSIPEDRNQAMAPAMLLMAWRHQKALEAIVRDQKAPQALKLLVNQSILMPHSNTAETAKQREHKPTRAASLTNNGHIERKVDQSTVSTEAEQKSSTTPRST